MASALDITGFGTMRPAARRLVGIGVLAAIPAAASGTSDWADTLGKERRIGTVHAVGNIAGTGLQLVSWAVRRCGHHRIGAGLSATALVSTLGSAYLGGHLSFARGIGVNHTAFEKSVHEWTDVAAEDDVSDGDLLRVSAKDTPVVLTRHAGQIRALSATCLHAGGPLDKGHIENDCLVCPWHKSQFRLSDGEPMRGPAAMPQPTWQVHTAEGRVYVKSRS